jgi:Sec-independent protein translocase protein TatA
VSLFVILSLAVAVVVAAVLVLAGLQLWRAVGRLTRVAGEVRDKLAPLTQELQDEIAVTANESAALQETVGVWQRERELRRRDKEGLRKGVRRTVRRG